MKKVSYVVAETLEKLGIKHAFGIIGAGNVHLYEAIINYGYTELICVHHEQAAAMAMQTYYRTSGKLAACILTTGAGSTNAVTGVLSAWADSIPGILIAGNEKSMYTSDSNPLRMWGVQGYDSVDMVKKITKYSDRVTNPLLSSYQILKAADISTSGRYGPCWVEIPMDIQSSLVNENELVQYKKITKKLPKPNKVSITRVLSNLKKARRPLLWIGHGIRLSECHKHIQTYVEKLNVPVLVSWAGIDMIDSDHPLVFGRAGIYGQRAANFILQNCDYLLTIGTRLALPQVAYDPTELARDATIDVVDIDENEALKLKPRIREAIISDANEFFIQLLENIDFEIDCKEWIDNCKKYQMDYPWVNDEDHPDIDGFMNSYKFMEVLNKHFKEDQIVVTDMGTALLSGHQVLKFKQGQRFMTSTGLGEMGYGLPAAIGASFADKKREVMCLNCDGGMMMNLQELQTVVHHNLPIKFFIFNNDGYLMIKHNQQSIFKKGYFASDKNTGVSCPDYTKIATAFDIPSYVIKTWEECDDVIDKVQQHNGPVICEVYMHPSQLFSPKLGFTIKGDGTMVSSPLEDLHPLLPREKLQQSMIIEMSEKSKL